MQEAGISVCIITLNEEHNIRECLESIQWVDEIIVIDSGSEDRTVSICEEFGAKIFHQPFKGFRDQKNEALEKASHDWILSIDADERVTEGLRDEISMLIRESSEVVGYFVPRLNYYGSKFIKHSGWYPDHTLRLWKRSKGRWIGKNVHEKVEIDGKVGYCREAIKHFTYRNGSDYIKRINLYSSLLAQEKYHQGKRFSTPRLLLKPALRFLKSYIWKLGVLDGVEGIIIAVSSGYLTFMEEVKLRELSK